MDRETVIRLAREAGCIFPLRSGFGDCRVPQFFGVDGLERFAAAVEANCVPPGWKLVPIMPTEAMQEAFYAQMEKGEWAMATWEAMLAAAPAPKEES